MFRDFSAGGRDAEVKAATIRDVAREAEVSVASVSRVLNGVGRVGEATRGRILQAAERLRYVPHEGARSLIKRRTATVGMILPDLHGEFFSELLRGADAAARAEGLHLLVSTSHGDPAEAATALRSMQGRVDGVLMMSPHLDDAFLARNLPDTLPAVLMNAPTCDGRPAFNVENHRGAATMVRHLASGSGARIAHIAGPAGNRDALDRLRGYLDARPEPLGDGYVVHGDFSVASGYAAGQALLALEPRPHAIFAANDMMAAGCLEALRHAGISVPNDIALGGFDDVPLASLLSPPLTTMRVDVAGIGERAIRELARVVEDPRAAGAAGATIVPELVIRKSCGHGGRAQKPASTGDAERGRYVE